MKTVDANGNATKCIMRQGSYVKARRYSKKVKRKKESNVTES